MSRLRKKLANKVSKVVGFEVDPNEIVFQKNGNRDGVVRWSMAGYECFRSGYYCVQPDVVLEVAEHLQPYGVREIYAVLPHLVDREDL